MTRSEASTNESGASLPTFAALLTALGLATAAAVFWWTRPDTPADDPLLTLPSATSSSSASPSSEPSAEPTPTESPTPQKPAIRRGKVDVTVLNATTVVGLAGEATTQAARAGWRTLEPGNTGIQPPSNTVFYSGDLKRAAQLLAKDLDISRVAVAPDGLPRGLVVVLISPL